MWTPYWSTSLGRVGAVLWFLEKPSTVVTNLITVVLHWCSSKPRYWVVSSVQVAQKKFPILTFDYCTTNQWLPSVWIFAIVQQCTFCGIAQPMILPQFTLVCVREVCTVIHDLHWSHWKKWISNLASYPHGFSHRYLCWINMRWLCILNTVRKDTWTMDQNRLWTI